MTGPHRDISNADSWRTTASTVGNSTLSNESRQVVDGVTRHGRCLAQCQDFSVAHLDSVLKVREQLIAQGRGIDARAESREFVTPGFPLHVQLIEAIHGLNARDCVRAGVPVRGRGL